MKISIITPSFNQGQYIEKTIKSVWEQSGDFDLEYIIADGGSTDNTINILKKYQNIYDKKLLKSNTRSFVFKWWSKKDNGQSAAIMEGVKFSTGSIINWINSDDYLYNNNVLDKVNSLFETYNVDVVVGNGEIVDENGSHKANFSHLTAIKSNNDFYKLLPKLIYGDFLCQQSVFIKKDVFEKHGLNNSLHYCMDWDLYLRLFKSKHVFYFIPEKLGVIREQLNAKTVMAPKRYFEERWKIYKKYGGWLSYGAGYALLKILFGNNIILEKLAKILRQKSSFYKLKV